MPGLTWGHSPNQRAVGSQTLSPLHVRKPLLPSHLCILLLLMTPASRVLVAHSDALFCLDATTIPCKRVTAISHPTERKPSQRVINSPPSHNLGHLDLLRCLGCRGASILGPESFCNTSGIALLSAPPPPPITTQEDGASIPSFSPSCQVTLH